MNLYSLDFIHTKKQMKANNEYCTVKRTDRERERERSRGWLLRTTYRLYGVQDFPLLSELLHVNLEERQVVINLRDKVQAGVVTQLSLTTTVCNTLLRED